MTTFKSKWTNEMREYIRNHFEELFNNECEGCPFEEQCGKEQMFYGCAVWEAEMGEDL